MRPRALVLGAAIALGASGALAQIATPPIAPAPSASASAPPPSSASALAGPRPLALTVSGGVSLGAYEAGVLYYVAETLKRNPKSARLFVGTGASAGSINALLTLLASCSPPEPHPTKSLLFQTWTGVGFKDLYVKNDVTPVSIFSQHALHAALDRVDARFREGFDERCNVAFGATTTRLAPKRENRDEGPMVTPPRVEERFDVRLVGRGAGRPPSVTNWVDREHGFPQPRLATDARGEVTFDTIRTLVLASGAFPLAFPPQSIALCDGRDGGPICTDAKVTKFIDGGVFDNQPLRLAMRLATAGLERRGDSFALAAEPSFARREPIPELVYVHVSPDAVAYPVAQLDDSQRAEQSVVSLLGRFAETFVGTARSKDVATVFEEHPELRDRLVESRLHYPTVSGLLGAFFGFFERDFRVFDFYLGMNDARRMVRTRLRDLLGAPELALPEATDGTGLIDDDLRPFACMRAVYEDLPNLASTCHDRELENFRVLLQVSVERVYDDCANLPKGTKTHHPQCADAIAGHPPPRIPGLRAAGYAGWRRSPGEGDFAYVMRRLVDYRFAFRDLGLDREHASEALRRIRLDLGDAIDRFASVQPGAEGALVDVAGIGAVNTLYYEPPAHVLYGAVGIPVELGYSRSFPRSTWFPSSLRLNAALDVRGIGSLLSSETKYLSASPVVGVEVDILRTQRFQPRLGLRGGVIGSTRSFAPTRCRDHALANEVGPCTRVTTQALAVLGLYDRLRVQLIAEWLPPLTKSQPGVFALQPGIGAEIGF